MKALNTGSPKPTNRQMYFKSIVLITDLYEWASLKEY